MARTKGGGANRTEHREAVYMREDVWQRMMAYWKPRRHEITKSRLMEQAVEYYLRLLETQDDGSKKVPPSPHPERMGKAGR
jgi:hypothetical protein